MTDERSDRVFVMTLSLGHEDYTVDFGARMEAFAELTEAFDDEEERTYTLRFHWISDSEYLALPEFEGF